MRSTNTTRQSPTRTLSPAAPMPGPETVTSGSLRRWPLPEPGAGKEERGTLLVVGGSATTPGAVRLAGEAGLRVGAGKLALASARSVASDLRRGRAGGEGAGGGGGRNRVAFTRRMPTRWWHWPRPRPRCSPDRASASLNPSIAFLAMMLPRLRRPIVLDALASAYLVESTQEVCVTSEAAPSSQVNPTELAHTAGRGARRKPAPTRSPPPCTSRDSATSSSSAGGGSEKYVAAPDGDTSVIPGGGPGLGVSGLRRRCRRVWSPDSWRAGPKPRRRRFGVPTSKAGG